MFAFCSKSKYSTNECPKSSAFEASSNKKSLEKVCEKTLKLIPVEVGGKLIRLNDENSNDILDFHSEIYN